MRALPGGLNAAGPGLAPPCSVGRDRDWVPCSRRALSASFAEHAACRAFAQAGAAGEI